MNGSIYLIKNTINNKIYIGQTTQSVDNRFKQHLKLLKSNEKQAIYKAIKKHGKNNFTCITLKTGITNYKELNKLEIEYIKQYNSMIPSGYNLCPGGQKWRRKCDISEKDKKNICELYANLASSRDISSRYQVSHHTILKILHDNNITMRDKANNLPNRSSKINKEILIKMYIDKKMKIRLIAKILNVNEKTISRAVKRYNLKEYNIDVKTSAQ